jgi:hypothetical protein
MEFWLVVGLIIGLVLVCAAISDRRASRTLSGRRLTDRV